MIVTVVEVADPDRFLEVFSTVGMRKRREHGCRRAAAYPDPANPRRIWSVFDWDTEDYQGFLDDPEVPAVAARLGLTAAPVHAVVAVELDA